jgi:phosphoglycolate phosphatase
VPRLARELRFRDPGPEGLRALRELPMGQVLSELGVAWWKVPLLLWRARVLLHREDDGIALFPGIAELLRELDGAGVEWGILTSNGHQVVRATLERAGAPEPGWLETGLGLGGKASRLRRMAGRLDVRPADLLLVSDELRDLDAARAAGVPVIAVGWGYSSPEALEGAGARVVRDVSALRAALVPQLAG